MVRGNDLGESGAKPDHTAFRRSALIVSPLLLPLTLALLLGACGIEDYPYLPQVDADNVVGSGNSELTVQLQSIDDAYTAYFSNFVIYYRIYISPVMESGQVVPSDMSRFNSYLYTDYTYFNPYTDPLNDTAGSASLHSLFTNRSYYTLSLADGDINTVLRISGGAKLTLRFPITGDDPTLTVGNTSYTLWRHLETGVNEKCEPDRLFINTEELREYAASEYAASKINRDVQLNSQGGNYTYAAFYIATGGIDLNYSPIYSKPTFLGVLKLPE